MLSETEFGDYLEEAVSELEEKQRSLEVEFRLGRHDRFVVDFVAGTLLFFDGEAPRVEARILPVATHVPVKNSLRWAWADPELPDAVRASAARVKMLHDLTGFAIFAEESPSCDETMAWEIVALAAKALSAPGAYRVPHANGVRSYVILTGVERLG